MSEADKLFEESGYETRHTFKTYFYINDSKNYDYIEFQKEKKIIEVRADLTMQELKAINAKVKELRMGVSRNAKNR